MRLARDVTLPEFSEAVTADRLRVVGLLRSYANWERDADAMLINALAGRLEQEIGQAAVTPAAKAWSEP